MDLSSLTICGRQFRLEDLQAIRQLIAQQPTITRAALSRQVCDQLGWFRPNGQRKDMSCRVALIRLERQGLITLPQPTRKIVKHRPSEPALLSPPSALTKSVTQLDQLTLVLVKAPHPQLSQLWKRLIDQYHYLGYQPLVGAQLRYLIHATDEGWLGAVGFSAAAWKVARRDQYIGWSDQARAARLHYIVANSRLLILPWVQVQNLASKVLALCAKRIAPDWRQHYGYQPVLLETFVDKERFRGTCYQAANWCYVGDTQGRGKLDRHHEYAVPMKKIYLYPLRHDFRPILCGSAGGVS